ncbi:hypothetical protein B0H17DRAFT_1202745 [Mycena rosella]|uniref:DUF4185 domain-containing protein n=1 Tax=Mycena rosella TaxID=1033263 RepID=A0AAD7DDP9_MYCRO|nr:hypothetical protein B0H17DRAFT_1202745 [Mycena rosella]
MTPRFFPYSALALIVCGTVLGAPSDDRGRIIPVVASTTTYGDLIDPGLNRDSCSSTLWANDVLWVCRDTQQAFANGSIGTHLVANTVSLSGLPSAPSNPIQLVLSSPQGYGPIFYAFEADECPQEGCGDGVCGPGICGDGTRWVNAYGFMAKQRLLGLSVVNATGYSLYHVTSQRPGVIPSAKMHINAFWSATQIGYGSAASVVRNGFAYLYGATPDRKLAVARAALTGLLSSLEDHKIYEYYVNGTWARTPPVNTDPTIVLPNTSAVQGTMYWSPKWQSYVWIGGDGFPNANFLISTAPKPEGPWSAPQQFYSGVVGNGTLAAYSAVAHPDLTDGTGNYIFITWTKTHFDVDGIFNVYEQPLVRVDWQ